MGNFIEIVTEDERNEYHSGDAVIGYRRFDSDVFEKLRKKRTHQRGFDRRTGQPRMETDETELNKDLLDYLIIDWTGVINPVTKEPVPCNRDTKCKLPARDRAAIIEEADSSKTQGREEQKEAEKKTSSSTQNT
jgi:hypothetical protein